MLALKSLPRDCILWALENKFPACLLGFCSIVTVHGEDGRDLFIFLCNVSLKGARKVGNDESSEELKSKSED